MKLRRPLVVAISCALLAACAMQPPAPVAPPATAVAAAPSTDAGQQLNALFERYFEDTLRLNPVLATYIGDHRYDDQLPNSIGPVYRAEAKALNERYLAEVQAIDVERLSPADRISYEIFVRERKRMRAGEQFPDHLLPINQAGSLITFMPSLGSGKNAQPFATVEDYERWLQRLDGMVVWMDQAIVNMREGMEKGVVQPRPVMEKVLPQLEAMIVARPEDSQFFAPAKAFPESIGPADRERLTAAYTATIRDEVIPAYVRLRDFVRDEYLPQTRSTVAWSALPDGQAWYAFQAQEHTTTNMTAEEIHQLGLSEVSRILGLMDEVRRTVGFKGDLQAFFTFLETDPQFYFTRGEDLLQGYRELKLRIDAALPKAFAVFPKADYEVREVEAFRAQSAAGAYYESPSADGSRPGVFYVNTFNLKAQPKFGMETLSLHEASPGHHFQRTIQQELEGLPRFRRFGGDYTAYTEGWALYAEYLGKELGMFTDPYQWYGRLNDEQLRAMRLVVDTGLHAKGWTREQAIQYMLDNSTMAESDVVSEVERYIAWPGQALGYKVGDLALQKLRRQAEAALGPKFDVRDFHREVLSDGAVPMDVLEAKIERWIAARQ
ncbi:MAG: DUF885 domain-containing protein [Steroidobacteraceae bacterium]|nr:DUF885 domain-containing protein [Steroidobacteraceae bacterium]